MDEERLAEIEARMRRYAADEDMPDAAWRALGFRLHLDCIALLAEVRRLRGEQLDGAVECGRD